MLNHIVLFKRRPDVPRQPELERSLVQGMQELGGDIDVVRGWKVRANEVRRPISWDYILESRFENVKALDACLQHPKYLALVAVLKIYFEWAACDYTIDL